MKGQKQLVKELVEEANILGRAISSYREAARTYGTDDVLTEIEARALNIIGEKENIGVKELSRITQRTKGATSMMIDKLVARGFLIKEKSEKDHRYSYLILTEKGNKIYTYHRELNDKYYSDLTQRLEKFSGKEYKKCIEIIKEITLYWNETKD